MSKDEFRRKEKNREAIFAGYIRNRKVEVLWKLSCAVACINILLHCLRWVVALMPLFGDYLTLVVWNIKKNCRLTKLEKNYFILFISIKAVMVC